MRELLAWYPVLIGQQMASANGGGCSILQSPVKFAIIVAALQGSRCESVRPHAVLHLP